MKVLDQLKQVALEEVPLLLEAVELDVDVELLMIVELEVFG